MLEIGWVKKKKAKNNYYDFYIQISHIKIVTKQNKKYLTENKKILKVWHSSKV